MTRIFTALMSHETNSFSPMPTGYGDFEETYARGGGTKGLARNIWTAPLQVWRERAEALGWEVAEGFMAKAGTSGLVVRSAYERIRDRILADLEAAMPVDACLLNLHGSMIADGYDDCEGDLLARVRARVGPDVPVLCELDLHAHISEAMATHADALVLYKEYPHHDFAERAEEVFALAEGMLAGRIHPRMAVFDCRMLGLFPTNRQPVRGFVDRMQALEGRDGILSVSLSHGYYWGDVADEGVKVVVVADGDRARAEALAETLGRAFRDMREEAQLGYTPLAEALDRLAAAREGRPIVLSDIADGQGGGGPGDSTFILREVFRRGITGTATAIFWDPLAVTTCLRAGPGARFTLRLGGKAGAVSGDPLDLEVTVARIVPDAVQSGETGDFPFGPAVVLEAAGNEIVVSARRLKIENTTAFTSVGIDPRARRGLLLKGQYNFVKDYEPFAEEILFVDTPGACRPDIRAMRYEKVRRPKWPLDQRAFEE